MKFNTNYENRLQYARVDSGSKSREQYHYRPGSTGLGGIPWSLFDCFKLRAYVFMLAFLRVKMKGGWDGFMGGKLCKNTHNNSNVRETISIQGFCL